LLAAPTWPRKQGFGRVNRSRRLRRNSCRKISSPLTWLPSRQSASCPQSPIDSARFALGRRWISCRTGHRISRRRRLRARPRRGPAFRTCRRRGPNPGRGSTASCARGRPGASGRQTVQCLAEPRRPNRTGRLGLTRLGGEFRTQSGAITGTPMHMGPSRSSRFPVRFPRGALPFNGIHRPQRQFQPIEDGGLFVTSQSDMTKARANADLAQVGGVRECRLAAVVSAVVF
jgi:hypothetical protein